MRRKIQHRGKSYVVSLDDEVPIAGRIWAVVSVRLIDEITLAPVTSPITISTNTRGLSPHVTGGGFGGLIGIPRLVFPDLASQDYQVHLTVRAHGYLPHHETLTFAQDEEFPHRFKSAKPDISMHRKPVAIVGRICRSNGSSSIPLDGAEVKIVGIWRTFPPADLELFPDSPNLVSLQPPLYAARSATTELRRIKMQPDNNEENTLVESVLQGQRILTLAHRRMLAQDNVIAIEDDTSERTECVKIASIAETGTTDGPAGITLYYPLAHAHSPGAPVRRATPEEPGQENLFDSPAIQGDSSIFLARITDLDDAEWVEVSEGAEPPEYHRLHRFDTVTDSDGRYRLPPLSRVAQVELEADVNGELVSRTFSPDYGYRENHVDFVR